MSHYQEKERASFREPEEDGIRSLEAVIGRLALKAARAVKYYGEDEFGEKKRQEVIYLLQQRMLKKTQKKSMSSFFVQILFFYYQKASKVKFKILYSFFHNIQSIKLSTSFRGNDGSFFEENPF